MPLDSLKNKKICIIYGGWSEEREISLVSGQAVYDVLKDSGYDLEKAKMVILRMARMGGGYYTEWMSSHPSGPDRILNFEERVE